MAAPRKSKASDLSGQNNDSHPEMPAGLKFDIEGEFAAWYSVRGWAAFPYQEEAFEAFREGKSGLMNAPTGSGKTMALFLPAIMRYLESTNGQPADRRTGTLMVWLTPVKALATDLQKAMQEAADSLNSGWRIEVRTGDTSLANRAKQKTNPPQCLITTPESLHLILCTKNYLDTFNSLQYIVVDEWHEMLGNKRGTQTVLAINHLLTRLTKLQIWGISATIGNLAEGLETLLGRCAATKPHIIIKAQIDKRIVVETLLPDEIETLPWGGHIGVKLLPLVIPIIDASTSTLVFTNTRNQAEVWYQHILSAAPHLAGTIALHHGSLSTEIRQWVENALRAGQLKCVVCTSSLDLGVDFKTVETIIQIGGPKGVARFLQRAGRSGHSPGALSKIWFVPTHSLELIEASALRQAIVDGKVESKVPIVRAFDVLSQFMLTLSCGDGFGADALYAEVKQTVCYATITREEYDQVLAFVITGGEALHAYPEFHRVVLNVETGLYHIANKMIAMRHRLSIGTIVSEPSIMVKYLTGGYLGTVEEFFVSKLKIGDVFSFSGRAVRLVSIQANTALVRKAESKRVATPSWAGGRMPLSSQLSEMIRHKLTEWLEGKPMDREMTKLTPLLQHQQSVSVVPSESQLLIEELHTREGTHLFFYTFEGRFVNEGMASLLALRLSAQQPLTFSISMNDYGFELLCPERIEISNFLDEDIFSTTNLLPDIMQSMNAAQLAARKFRDVARVAGLTFQGMPGKELKSKHLQANSKMFFDVYTAYDPNNLLLKQAYEEVLTDQLEEERLRAALLRIYSQQIVVKHINQPTPFCFPIFVERIRGKLTTEKLDTAIMKLIANFNDQPEIKAIKSNKFKTKPQPKPQLKKA